MLLAVVLHLLADPLGGAPQGQFAQGDQVALGEEVGDGPLGFTRDIDFAFPQTLQEVVRGQVD